MIKKQLLITIGAFFCVIAITIVVYWPGLSGSFVLDDTANIRGSRIENFNWTSILYALTHNGSGMLGRSVSVLSFIFTEWQFGSSPWGYKFHNLMLHLLNGLLLCRLLYLLLPLLGSKLSKPNALLIAGTTTSFWLIHPFLVSTVLYAVQRMVELAVFFSLLALLSYFHARVRDNFDRRFVVYGWVCFPILLVLAILSKEIGVLIPVYVLIIEFLVFNTSPQTLIQKRHILYWLLFFIVIPLLVAAAYLFSHFDDFTNYGTRTFTLYERLLTQLHVVAYYMRMIIVPRVKEMGLFHDDFPVAQSLDAHTIFLLGALIALLAAVWFFRQRAPVLAFGIAWFLGSQLLESTIIPLELVFEHRNYLGAVGLLLPIVFYVIQIQKTELKPLRWFITIYFVVFAGQAYSRSQEWSNLGVLLTVAVNDHPASPRARTDYANYLFNSGKRQEAIEQLIVTMDLDQRDAGSVIHQLILLCLDGKRSEELLVEAEKRLSLWPASAYALNAIINLIPITRDGRCNQLVKQDVEKLLAATISQPGNLTNENLHSNLLSFFGVYKFDEGKYEEGVDLVMQAYEINEDVLVLYRLVLLQIRYNQYEDAERTIEIMEQKNRESFGIETQLVNEIKAALSDARDTSSEDQTDGQIDLKVEESLIQ